MQILATVLILLLEDQPSVGKMKQYLSMELVLSHSMSKSGIMISSDLEPRISIIKVSNNTVSFSYLNYFCASTQVHECCLYLLKFNSVKSPFERSLLPRPEDFSKALYTFDIGQNDLSVAFRTMNDEQLRATIPNIISQFSTAVQVSF